MPQQALTAFEGEGNALETGISPPANYTGRVRERSSGPHTLADAVEQAADAGRTVTIPEPAGWDREPRQEPGERARWRRGPVVIAVIEVRTMTGREYEIDRQDDRPGRPASLVDRVDGFEAAIRRAVEHMSGYPDNGNA